jgi:hypothetical protein
MQENGNQENTMPGSKTKERKLGVGLLQSPQVIPPALLLGLGLLLANISPNIPEIVRLVLYGLWGRWGSVVVATRRFTRVLRRWRGRRGRRGW